MIEFLDTVAFVGVVDRRDQFHGLVTSYLDTFEGKMLTTEWVIVESLDSLAEPSYRSSAIGMIERFHTNPMVEIVPFDGRIYRDAYKLYRNRPDKGWSLTDCTSFVIMEQRKVIRALTADHHFRQAGFIPVFLPDTRL